MGSGDAERSVSDGQQGLDAERVETAGLVRGRRRRGRRCGGQVQQRWRWRRFAVGGRRAPERAATRASAVIVFRATTVVAATSGRGRRSRRRRDGGRGRPGVRWQSFVLVLVLVIVVVVLVVVFVVIVVLVERGARAPPAMVPVVQHPVVEVLLADHVNLLVPARLSATAARRIVKR